MLTADVSIKYRYGAVPFVVGTITVIFPDAEPVQDAFTVVAVVVKPVPLPTLPVMFLIQPAASTTFMV